MNVRVITAALCAGFFAEMAPAQTVDMTGYRPQPGLVAVSEGGSLAVTWDGERGQELQARFSVVDGTPTVRELGVRNKGGARTTLGRDLVPEFGVTTGVRRTGHRLAVAGGKNGSVAVFPPPHQFFFARELEVNLGYVWHRRDGGRAFALGVRQGENAEGYNPTWAEKVFSLYNAPPGTQQRMPVYF